MKIITGTKTDHVDFVDCPGCNYNNYANQQRGTKFNCGNCGAVFYLEGSIFTKGYVPARRIKNREK